MDPPIAPARQPPPEKWWTRAQFQTSTRERREGFALFLGVTLVWTLGLAAADQEWIAYNTLLWLFAWVLSAISLVVTGYLLGRYTDALWLGWIPGAALIATSFVLFFAGQPGMTILCVGATVLISALVCFLRLIALGAWLRRRRNTEAGPPPFARSFSRPG
jgi:hypothetical protein